MVAGWTQEVRVVLCCNTCVEKVNDALTEMQGVESHKIDRWNDLVTVVETTKGTDHKKLLKTLKKLTHEKKADILRSLPPKEKPEPKVTTTTTESNLSYIFNGGLVPWPPGGSSSSSNSPAITNFNYFKHPTGCHLCYGYSDIICANCGRRSELGGW